MTSGDLLTLSPLAIAAAAMIVLLLGIAVHRRFGLSVGIALAAAAAGLIAVLRVSPLAPRSVTALFLADRAFLFFTGLFFAAVFILSLSAASYFRPSAKGREEFFPLMMAALLGACVLAGSVHFVSFFLGLETLSVSLYALISLPSDRREAIEAGLKYLVLASASAAFLVFGAALIYAETGALDFSGWAAAGVAGTPLVPLGIGLMIVGIGFKLAVVPFHMWTPDVYQGAPAPAAAFVATVSKGSMLVFLIRLFGIVNIRLYPSLVLVIALIAGASMIAGNLLALRQVRLKRILAYSSIAHMGYLLVAFLAGGPGGVEAASFYLVAYILTMTGAFAAVSVLSAEDRDADILEDYRGLFWSRPAVAAALTIALLSLAGIPLTAGFLGKVYVAAAGVRSSLWALVVILVATSVIGLYYYLRVIVVMYARPEVRSEEPARPPLPRGARLAGGIALTLTILLLLWFGIFPSGLAELIRTAAGTITNIAPPGAGGILP